MLCYVRYYLVDCIRIIILKNVRTLSLERYCLSVSRVFVSDFNHMFLLINSAYCNIVNYVTCTYHLNVFQLILVALFISGKPTN